MLENSRALFSQRVWNFWDSYDTVNDDAKGGDLRLFDKRPDSPNRDFHNLLHPNTINNGDETVVIERWYARADHGITVETLARTIVTLTMGCSPMREVPMDHLFDGPQGGVLDTRGVRCDLVVPIRQGIEARVRPSTTCRNAAGSGRIWIHLVVVPYSERRHAAIMSR